MLLCPSTVLIETSFLIKTYSKLNTAFQTPLIAKNTHIKGIIVKGYCLVSSLVALQGYDSIKLRTSDVSSRRVNMLVRFGYV